MESVPPVFLSSNSGRTPAHTRSARAERKPGTRRSPSSSIWSTSSWVTGSSSACLERMSVVPITLTVRIGTRMSPSAGIVQRLTTVFTSRWFMAIMIPLPGATWTPSHAGHGRHLGGPGAGGVEREGRLDVELLAGELVAQARADDLVALAPDRHDAVVGEHARAVRRRAVGQRPDELPHVDRRRPGR